MKRNSDTNMTDWTTLVQDLFERLLQHLPGRRWVLPIAGVLLAVGVLTARDSGLPAEAAPFHKRTLALEFARTQEAVIRLAPTKDLQQQLTKGLQLDSTVIIPIYWIFFIGVSAFMYGSQAPWKGVWLILVPLTISLTAVADQIENLSALAALDSRSGVASLHAAAVLKWGGLGVSCALTAVGFFRSGRWALPAAIAYLGCALVMGYALLYCEPRVEIAFALLGIAVALTGEAVRSVKRFPLPHGLDN